MPETEMTGNIFLVGEAVTAAPARAIVRPEALLLEKVRAGDKEAFGEIYKIFAPLIHGIVLARVPRDEVQDIVQEVFVAAYKSLHTLRDENAIGAWLAMIARNRAIEFYRHAKPTEELSENLIGRNDPRTEAREILAAIRSLSETYRETLILRLVEGMTGSEIAERTGLTPESVRVNLHRGMELLRQKLGIVGVKK